MCQLVGLIQCSVLSSACSPSSYVVHLGSLGFSRLPKNISKNAQVVMNWHHSQDLFLFHNQHSSRIKWSYQRIMLLGPRDQKSLSSLHQGQKNAIKIKALRECNGDISAVILPLDLALALLEHCYYEMLSQGLEGYSEEDCCGKQTNRITYTIAHPKRFRRVSVKVNTEINPPRR